jgi:predicted negative regulator of RcsB-dependent stress response
MKRKKRRQLKEDELISTVNKIAIFLKKHTRELFALGILILIVFVIIIGARFVRLQNTKKENRLLTQILQVSSELDENPENVAKLEELAGTGKFTRLGYILLAGYWIEQGDYDKATASLEKIQKSKKDFIYFRAQDLMATIQFKRNNYDEAIEIYKKIEKEKPKHFSLEVILFKRAEVHEEKGEKEKALTLYKRIKDEFPQTYYSMDASQRIEKLEKKE